MDQILTLRVSNDLASRLETAAKRTNRTRSDLVRAALEQFLEIEPNIKPFDLVQDLLGSVNTGIADLGENHRKYLIKRIRRERRTGN